MNLNLLKDLCDISAVSGNEENLRDFIASKIRDHVSGINVDALGNLIVKKNGKNNDEENSKRIVLTANMDEPGLIISHITDGGFLKFGTVGKVCSKALLGTRVLVGKNNLPGVVGSTPVHLLKEDSKYKEVLVKDMYIDIGAKSKEDAKKYINLGDYVCFLSDFIQNENIIIARALSSKIACFLLINLIKKEYKKDIYLAFTTNGNTNFAGAKTMAYSLSPDLAIVLSAVCANESYPRLQDGPVLPFMEPCTIHSKGLYNEVLDLANKNNVPIQTTKSNIKTSASVISKTKNGVQTVNLAFPCKYIHSPLEMCSSLDLENTERLLDYLVINLVQ